MTIFIWDKRFGWGNMYIHTYMGVCTCTGIHMYMCAYVSLCVSMCVSVCIYFSLTLSLYLCVINEFLLNSEVHFLETAIPSLCFTVLLHRGLSGLAGETGIHSKPYALSGLKEDLKQLGVLPCKTGMQKQFQKVCLL